MPQTESHLLQTLLNNLNRGILLEDTQRVIRLVNPHFCELFGIPGNPDVLVGENCQDVVRQVKGLFEEPDAYGASVEQLIKKAQPVSRERWRLKDGRTFERDFIPVVEDGKLTSFFWIYQDVTNEVEQSNRIKKDTYFRRLLENMQLGMVESDTDGFIMDVTEPFCEMLGYKREEIVGQHGDELLQDASQKAILQAQTNLREKGISSVYELMLKRKDGSKMWMLVSGAPLYNQDNELIGSFGIHMDITQRKKDVRLLQEARSKAEQASKAKEQLMANVSHEMRTPMNGIVGFTNLLMADPQLTGQQRFYLDAIQRSANNLQLTIEDLLDFTKIEKGKILFDERPFELGKLVETITSAYTDLAREGGNKMDVSVDPSIPKFLIGDPAKTGQVIKHLLVHSLRTTSNGTVFLEVVGQDVGERYQVIIRVQDTGKGYTNKEVSQLFESFFMPDKEYTRAVGTGVGLAIVKRILDRMGADIEVVSTPNKGTTYEAEISFGKEAERMKGKPARPVKKPEDVHILVAEDNEINQMLIRENLKRWNFSYEIVDTGTAALNALGQHSFDLVLMDLQMPEMGGIEATTIIRNEFKEPVKSIPIIALTAYALREDRDRCLSAGMNDYVSKPFSPETLLEKLTRHVTKYRIALQEPEGAVQDDQPKLEHISIDQMNLFTRGNDALQKALINKTVSQADQIMETLRTMTKGEKWADLFSEVHRLKPNVSLMGMMRIEPLIREINEDLRYKENLDTIPKRMNQFLAGYTKAIEELMSLQ